jgi:hypothetical protein
MKRTWTVCFNLINYTQSSIFFFRSAQPSRLTSPPPFDSEAVLTSTWLRLSSIPLLRLVQPSRLTVVISNRCSPFSVQRIISGGAHLRFTLSLALHFTLSLSLSLSASSDSPKRPQISSNRKGDGNPNYMKHPNSSIISRRQSIEIL